MRSEPLTRLGGLLEIGLHPDPESLKSECRRLRAAGFVEAYLGDLFLEYLPAPRSPDPDRLIFVETGGALCFRPEETYALVREVIAEEGLILESAHYNQMLPPPGTWPTDWLHAYHERMLKIAASMELKRVTTHPGWMFGSAMETYTGEAARAFQRKDLTMTRLNRAAFEAYGGDEKVWRDSVELYRWLCGKAAAYGITITIETAISEWYDLTLDPGRLLSFCDEVGATNLGICVDSGHCHLNGLDTPGVIRTCGPLLLETHFHDNYGERDEHNPLGEGTVDWAGIVQALRDIQYSGLVTFEQRDHAANGRRWREFLTS